MCRKIYGTIFKLDQQLVLASVGLQIVTQGGSGHRLHGLDMQMHMGNLLYMGVVLPYTLRKIWAC